MRYRYLYSLLFCFLFVGCDLDIPVRSDTIEIREYNELGKLSKFISLPKEAISVRWETTKDLRYVEALFRYSDDDYQYIIENSTPTDSQDNVLLDINYYKEWVPKSLQQKIEVKVQYGDNYELMGIEHTHSGIDWQLRLSSLPQRVIYTCFDNKFAAPWEGTIRIVFAPRGCRSDTGIYLVSYRFEVRFPSLPAQLCRHLQALTASHLYISSNIHIINIRKNIGKNYILANFIPIFRGQEKHFRYAEATDAAELLTNKASNSKSI